MSNSSERIPMRMVSPGDIFAGSGFTATSHAFRGLRTPTGRVLVNGFYPGSPEKTHTFNSSTTVNLA